MILLLISLLAGLLTVISPCILPLLPVTVAGSLTGERSLSRALTVTIALGVSVFLFTLLLKVSTVFIHVPPIFWSILSGGLVIIVGLATLFPVLLEKIGFLNSINRSSNRALATGYQKQSFWGDVIVGSALGPVFSSCSPTYFVVLATVLPVSFALGLLDILAYVIGLCAALLAVAFVGQRVLDRLGVAADPRGVLMRTLGVIFILVGIAIITGFDKTLEKPLYSIFDETKIEQILLSQRTSGAVNASSTPSQTTNSTLTESTMHFLSPAEKAQKYTQAPELVSPDAYLNTGGAPITLAQYRGKNVVLIDFWTYSCINCQRTLPYLTTWYGKYKDEGLVIIGVHTPEFAFEHVVSNVAAALKQFGITYPVVLDNEYKTWDAYGNQFWPHEYLIDIDGYIVHDHIGEGAYDETEKAIQTALEERNARLKTGETVPSSIAAPIVDAPSDTNSYTPETYFGSSRNEFLTNGAGGVDGPQQLSIPNSLEADKLYLGGSWNFYPEYATASAGASVALSYHAKNVFLVASSPSVSGAVVDIKVDGVDQGSVTVTANKLYTLIKGSSWGARRVDLIIKSGTLDAYTFTFG